MEGGLPLHPLPIMKPLHGTSERCVTVDTCCLAVHYLMELSKRQLISSRGRNSTREPGVLSRSFGTRSYVEGEGVEGGVPPPACE